MESIRRPAINSEVLKSSVISSSEKRPPLIEGYVHENQSIMVSSDTGIGKSTITACWMAQASSGLPVFGGLFVPRPLIIYYIPFERGNQEIMERFKHIQEAVPVNYDNIYINDNFAGLNVTNDKHADEIVFNIHQDIGTRHIDIIVLDPIYASVAGGLSTDEKASQFVRFSTRLMNEFKCSNMLLHHTSRDTYSSQTGQKIEKDDPFYGSMWLKAHCNGGFFLKRDGEGTLMIKKKDSQGVLLNKIPLGYKPESYTVYLNGLDLSMQAKDRLLMAYRTFKNTNKKVTFSQISGCMMGVSDSHLRELLRTPPFNTAFKKHMSSGGNTLYEPVDEI